MNTNFDDFDTKIQPEELEARLTPEEIDAMAREDLERSAYEAGFYGDKDGEGAMPCGLTVEEQTIWLEKFHEGVADERETADCERGYAAMMDSLYGTD